MKAKIKQKTQANVKRKIKESKIKRMKQKCCKQGKKTEGVFKENVK